MPRSVADRDVECAELRLELARMNDELSKARDAVSALELQLQNAENQRDALLKDRDGCKHQLDMYATAWLRELGTGPWLRGKRHEIDALVLSTKGMRDAAEAGVRSAKAWEVLRRMRAVWDVMRTTEGFAKDASTIALTVRFMSEICEEAHKEAP